MVEAIIFHLLYLGGAVACCRWARRRIAPLSPLRRRFAATGTFALLFAPGIFWSFPFAVPTFALFALMVQLLASLDNGGLFLLPQMFFTFVPILVVWAVILGAAQIIASIRARRGSMNARPD
jgi:hypothetical protein